MNQEAFMKNKYLLIILFMLNLSCKEDAFLGNPLTDSIESGITALADVADEESSETFAFNSSDEKNYINNFMKTFSISKAFAADCTRVSAQTCNSGDKTISYVDCTVPNTDQIINGFVTLTYSSPTCDLSSIGATVTRSYNYTRTTPWGAVITVSADNKMDYAGNTYGGGGLVRRVVGGSFEIEIAGKHRQRTTARGRSAFDISLRTLNSISVSSLERDGRTVTGGRLEIAHNIKRFTVALEPNNLTYVSNCCYPVSGRIDVSLTGTINGSGSVNFNGCGNATLSRNGTTIDIPLYSCE